MGSSSDYHRQIKQGRSNFLAMAATYFLGAFNDNFFKQAAMLLAVSAGRSSLQGTATILFALPFVLFSAWGGWCADRFTKRRVVIGVKWLELAAMLTGAYGLYTLNWTYILAMVFLMALQSAIFGPALNGSIPELYPEHYVARANAYLKIASTTAILFGIASAGICLDRNWFHTAVPFGRILVAVTAILVALLGIFASFGVPKRKAAGADFAFPLLGPLHSLKDLWRLRNDAMLIHAILADSFFYFIASLALLFTNTLGIVQLGFSQTMTSLLSVVLTVGVCCGALLAAWLSTDKSLPWHRLLGPSAVSMGASMAVVSASGLGPEHFRLVLSYGGLFMAGCAGGVFIIPLTSFIQIRPRANEKGRVIAASNFASFIAIITAGQLYYLIHDSYRPTTLFLMTGILAAAAGTGLFFLFRQHPRPLRRDKPANGCLLRIGVRLCAFLLRLRYRISVKGLDRIPVLNDGRGTLFLPNHPALIDPVIVGSLLFDSFQPRPLSDQAQARKPLIRRILRAMNVIEIPDLATSGRQGRSEVVKALRQVSTALNNGENVIFYPAGRLYRSRHEALGGNSGLSTILENAPDARIVLVRTSGLWGSSFSWAGGKRPGMFRDLRSHLLRLLANVLFFMPKRPVTVEFSPEDFLRHLDRTAQNQALERYYNHRTTHRISVPYFWWQGRSIQQIVEEEQTTGTPDISHVDRETREKLISRISEIAGGVAVSETDRLMNDIGIDSLTLLELTAWIEEQFGVHIEQTDDLETVAQWILAAAGKTSLETGAQKTAIDRRWFDEKGRTALTLDHAPTIAGAFLQQARLRSKEAIIVDQVSGVKTYRDILTTVFALKPLVSRMNGARIGIMLPASVASVIAWLTVMFSGKTPVLINWTVGSSHLSHCLKNAGVTEVISAGRLVNRLGRYGIDTSDLAVTFHVLEDMATQISKTAKLSAALKARFFPFLLARERISQTAVILFTSGSEAAPKSVPLSHRNILANLTDFSQTITFRENDRLLAMLPPFHSLGFSGTMVMPLCLGLRTAYYADPTQGAQLATMTRRYGITSTVATPTFLNHMMQAAAPGDLDTLRLVFTGAEKCPETLYKNFAGRNPHARICEGYGITECAPLISLNVPDNPRPGSIGKVMKSMKFIIVHPDTGEEVARGRQGHLLVTGPNVFSGYLDEGVKTPFITRNDTTWYATGDLVAEIDGLLEFRGRIKRFIKRAGEMISLPAIEAVLLERFRADKTEGPHLAVEAAADKEDPEIVLFTTFEVTCEQANRAIREAGLSSLHWIKKVRIVREIPVLGTGKTDYKQLQLLAA